MPSIKLDDAALLVAGFVERTEVRRKFENGKIVPDATDGLDVLVKASTIGYVSVRLTEDQRRELRVEPGHEVAWFVKFSEYTQSDNGRKNFTPKFVREAFVQDVQELGLIVERITGQKVAPVK